MDESQVPGIQSSMRITLVTRYYAPFVGGIETHAAQLAAKLQKRGAIVRVVCLATSPGHSSAQATDEWLDGILVRRVGSRGLGESLRWPRQLIEDGSCDVVHLHGFSRPLLLRLAYDARGTPMIVTPHGGVRGALADPLPIRRVSKAVFDQSVGRWLARRASRVIALTELEAHYLERCFALDRSRIAIVPNALPREAFEFASATQGESHRLLTLSRLEPIKRIGDLLLALRLLSDPPGCDIVGPDQGELDQLIDLSVGIGPGVVRFLGPVYGTAKRRLLRAAKALILPSLMETLSITALEAIAQGTPVIASETAAAGLPAGALLTYPVGDVRALADRIKSLDDQEVMAGLREKSLEARLTILTDDQQVDRILALYADVQGSQPAQPIELQ